MPRSISKVREIRVVSPEEEKKGYGGKDLRKKNVLSLEWKWSIAVNVWFRAKWNELKRNEMASIAKLTCPLASSTLLVSLSFSNETLCLASCSPLSGESGCV